ncbi:hypothetical protein D3C87_2091990 [compost metagenome]
MLHIEQRDAGRRLDLADQAADRRLRRMQHARGAGGGARQHDGAESFNLAKVKRAAHLGRSGAGSPHAGGRKCYINFA